jgi:replicative DNA helicase
MSDLLSSEAAEQAVIGAAMIDPDAFGVAEECGLGAEHFAQAGHRVLWEAMAAMRAEGMPLDAITLLERLTGDALERAGGKGYVLELISETPSAANTEAYARIVLERAQARRWFVTLSSARDGFLDPACPDPVARAEALLAGLETRPGLARFEVLASVMRGEIEKLDHKWNHPGIEGLQTGYHNIDHRLGGLQSGELVVVGARPGMGKTAYALNVVRQVALQRLPGAVLIYSLEMTAGSLAQRLLAAQGRIKKDLLRSAKVFDHADSSTRLVAAMEALKDLDVRICDQPGLTVREVRSMALAERRRRGVRLVVVDYLGLIEHEGRERSTADQIGDVTRTLKRLARELGCPVMVLAQLNRSVDERPNKRPVLRDLRDSGAIEQDADVVQFLYRDEYYTKEASQYPGQVEVITAKSREAEIGSDFLTWQGQYQLMESNSIYDNGAPPQKKARDDSWY